MEVFQCVIVLMLLVDFGRTDVYPSIQWTYMNPVFKRNRTQCVYPQSKLYFVCPNTATIVTRLQRNGNPRPQYENLWLVSKQGYERCEVNKTVDRKLIECNKPFSLLYYRVTFMKYSPGNEPEFKPGKDYYFIVSMLNDDLREITKWCCRNSLLLNPDKTKLLAIGVPQLTKTLPTLSLTLMGKNIEPVTTAKDLGIYIDNNLNCNDHINKTSSSCIYKLIMINRIKYLLDKKTAILLLTHSFVSNKLFYCSSVWSNTSKKKR